MSSPTVRGPSPSSSRIRSRAGSPRTRKNRAAAATLVEARVAGYISGKQDIIVGMTSRVLEPPSDSQALIRTAAFRLLLERSAPLSPDDLQQATGIRPERLTGLLGDLDRAGRIRRDESGNVVGSAGLSVTADRHE